MTRVFLVERRYDDAGPDYSDIVGVYSSLERAKRAVQRDLETYYLNLWENYGDESTDELGYWVLKLGISYSITELQVDEEDSNHAESQQDTKQEFRLYEADYITVGGHAHV